MEKKPKWMELPRCVVIGHGVLSEVSNVCRTLKLVGHAAVIVDGITVRIAGKKVADILRDGGYGVSIIKTESITGSEIKRAAKNAGRVRSNFVLGVGGGRVIDMAKVVSTRLQIPFLSVPTAASHDGIVSPRASVNRSGRSVSVTAQSPLGIIADTKIIASAPPRMMLAGCGDLISNYTAVLDWQLANKVRGEEYSEYAAALSEMSAKIIMDKADALKPAQEESVRVVLKALVSSGVAMSIAGSSRPASGSEHKFSHALDRIAKKPALHGEQCAVGTIMMMYLHGGDWRHIKDSLEKMGAPATARELGISDEETIKALVNARRIRPERYTILEHVRLGKSAAEEVAVATGVIEG
jgi:glycerol-1-phosphate dehydrogenase [NAD(P)+]